MNKEQFLLMKMSEECAEVAQRAVKSFQYGSQQVWAGEEVPGGVGPSDAGLNNAQRLTSELVDLTIVCDLLAELGAITPPPEDFEELKKIKIKKLNKYLTFSRSLGMIDGDWTI